MTRQMTSGWQKRTAEVAASASVYLPACDSKHLQAQIPNFERGTWPGPQRIP